MLQATRDSLLLKLRPFGLAMALALLPAFSNASCFNDPEKFFSEQRGRADLFACDDGENLRFCTSAEPGESCRRVNLEHGLKIIDSNTNKLNAPSRAALTELRQNRGLNKQVLAAYLDLMKFQGGIILSHEFSIQTGRYAQLSADSIAINAKCMATIMLAAYRLHSNFPDYNFVIDSHLQNCQNLRDGLKQIIANQSRVKSNLDHFNSPLHSVYLTNRTKFNHFMLGEMGLYVNVDRNGEIKRRLIDFDVSTSAIHHENPPSERVSDLSF